MNGHRAVVAASCVAALAQLKISGVLTHFIPLARGRGLRPLEAFVAMLVRTRMFFTGMVGVEGIPGRVLSDRASLPLLLALVTALCLALVVSTSWRERLSVVLTVPALVLIPPILQTPSAYDQGIIWQPRYSACS